MQNDNTLADLRALTALARAGTLSAAELSDETGFSRSTAYRMLADMENEGWVSGTGTPKRFQLTLRLMQLGILEIRKQTWRDAVLPAVMELATEVGLRCSTSVYESGDVIIVDAVRRSAGRMSPALNGSRAPALVTAAGKILAAHAGEEEMTRVIARGLPQYTKFTKQDPAELRAELVKAREVGYAMADREFSLDAAGVAVAVYDAENRPVAAIGVSVFPLESSAVAALLPVLQGYAERASFELGHRRTVLDHLSLA